MILRDLRSSGEILVILVSGGDTSRYRCAVNLYKVKKPRAWRSTSTVTLCRVLRRGRLRAVEKPAPSRRGAVTRLKGSGLRAVEKPTPYW